MRVTSPCRQCLVRHALVEQDAVTAPHRLQVKAGREVSHAGPCGLLVADEVSPRVGIGFRFHEPVLRCHAGAGLVRCTEMEPTDAEKLKARRVQQLLYALMAVMIGIPVIILFLRSAR